MVKQEREPAVWRHDALAADLASHLRANTLRMVWENMQLGPSGSPRPDVYTIEKSYSKFRPQAYEIKVSVSDFRSDVTSGKWHKYLDFACGVTFAAPAGLLKKEDIPKQCGLIVRHENSWRHVKRPVLNPVDTLDRAAWMKLLIDGVDRCHAAAVKPRPASEWHHAAEMRARFGDEMGAAVRNRDDLLQRLQFASKQLQSEIDGINASRAEREKDRLESMRIEHDQLWNKVVEMADELGCDRSTWAVRRALADLRSDHDREALEAARSILVDMHERTKKAAQELSGRLGISAGEEI